MTVRTRRPYPSVRNDRIGKAIAPGTARAVSVADARTLTAAALGIRPFNGIQCAHCKAGLHDRIGNPRWDVVAGQFVCVGGCKAAAK